MKMKELMGTLSPVYGMAKGEGLFGNAVGILPAIAKDMRDDRKDKKDAAAAAEEKKPATAMKNGGSVSSASKRADGICKKGKTRGKMV
jgi:hypothetical protein